MLAVINRYCSCLDGYLYACYNKELKLISDSYQSEFDWSTVCKYLCLEEPVISCLIHISNQED